MTTSATPTWAGATSVVPQYRVVGDYWTFAVAYTNPDGTAASMTGETPGAVLWPGYNGPAVALSVLSSTANTVTFGFAGSAGLVPQGQDAWSYPVRLQAFLTDALGHQITYTITPVVPVAPQTADLSLLPAPTAIVAVAGPQGPQGVAGIAADQAAIDTAIAQAIQSQIPLLKGDTGAAGPAGPVGPVGATGATGPKGDAGAVGATGPAGLTGQTGATGAKGDTGGIGPAGSTGPVGPQGDPGAQGVAGPTGLKGDTGNQGTTGAAGPTGPVGPMGDTGGTGPQGPQGPQGAQGLQGIPGAVGPSGLIFAAGPPNAATGIDGQAYIDTQALALYLRSAGIWTLFGYLSASPVTGGGTSDLSGALVLDLSVPGSFWLQ